jgi:hypothetical protein
MQDGHVIDEDSRESVTPPRKITTLTLTYKEPGKTYDESMLLQMDLEEPESRWAPFNNKRRFNFAKDIIERYTTKALTERLLQSNTHWGSDGPPFWSADNLFKMLDVVSYEMGYQSWRCGSVDFTLA